MTRDRYEIVPHMRAYGAIPRVLSPYMSTISMPCFQSEVVNTDGLGFRVSHSRRGLIDSQSWWNPGKRGIVLGGSNVFGVGATHDRHTLVSVLNSLTEYSFLNLGIRAGNSTQELISAIPFLADSDYVIVCSGLNTLLAGIQSTGTNDLYGPLFAEELMEELGSYPIRELSRMVQASLRGVSFHYLVSEAITRIVRRLPPFRRRSSLPQPTTMSQSGLDSHRLRELVSKSLDRQRRDLTVIARSTANLIFFAQPFADASRKELCLQERQLFEIADSLQGAHWQVIKKYLVELWPEYVSDLREICREQGIPFVDLNKIDLSGWSYVDRVHMTDHGYEQVSQNIASRIDGCA